MILYTFDTPLCPECNEPPNRVIHQVWVDYEIKRRKDGTFRETGVTDTDWETCEPLRNGNKEIYLACRNVHFWYSGYSCES